MTLDITWSANRVVCEASRATAFAITDTKLVSNCNFVNSRQCKVASRIKFNF